MGADEIERYQQQQQQQIDESRAEAEEEDPSLNDMDIEEESEDSADVSVTHWSHFEWTFLQNFLTVNVNAGFKSTASFHKIAHCANFSRRDLAR